MTVAALAAYRFVYYIGPWLTASLVLLSWATRQSTRRTAVARRVVAALVGAGGVLIVVSSASPALHARLILLERYVPLPLVEAGQVASALAGLLLLTLARGLARGYRAAYSGTLALLLLAGFASLLKGLDWEESVSLGVVAIAAWSHAGLFDRESGGDWLETADLGLGFVALLVFVVFGTFSHRLGAGGLARFDRARLPFPGGEVPAQRRLDAAVPSARPASTCCCERPSTSRRRRRPRSSARSSSTPATGPARRR